MVLPLAPPSHSLSKAAEVYEALTQSGIEVLHDDRDMRAGEKFAEADLLGIPYRVVIGKRSIESGEAELKSRTDETIETVPFDQLSTVIHRRYADQKSGE